MKRDGCIGRAVSGLLERAGHKVGTAVGGQATGTADGDVPMLELNPDYDYFEGMLEPLFNARQGIQAARRK